MWGSSYNKRRRNDNLRLCEECEETEYDEEEDDYGLCGNCQRTMCIECYRQASTCVVCDGLDRQTEGPTCCERCMDSCDECDVVFHRPCKAVHLANCNSLSRAERAASSAAQTVVDLETELQGAKTELERCQSNVKNLESRLNEAKEEQATADEALAKESGSKSGAAAKTEKS